MRNLFLPPSKKELRDTATPFLYAKKRVLFLDDEEILRTLMKVTVSKFNVELTMVSGVSEAIHVLDNSPPFDLLMLDVKLANGSGIDVYKRSIAHNPTVEVVFLTGWDVPQVRDAIEKIGPARLYGKTRAMTPQFLFTLFRQLGFTPTEL